MSTSSRDHGLRLVAGSTPPAQQKVVPDTRSASVAVRTVGDHLVLAFDPEAPFKSVRAELARLLQPLSLDAMPEGGQQQRHMARLDLGTRPIELFDLRRVVHLLKERYAVDVVGMYCTASAAHRYLEKELKLRVHLGEVADDSAAADLARVDPDDPRDTDWTMVSTPVVYTPVEPPPQEGLGDEVGEEPAELLVDLDDETLAPDPPAHLAREAGRCASSEGGDFALGDPTEGEPGSDDGAPEARCAPLRPDVAVDDPEASPTEGGSDSAALGDASEHIDTGASELPAGRVAEVPHAELPDADFPNINLLETDGAADDPRGADGSENISENILDADTVDEALPLAAAPPALFGPNRRVHVVERTMRSGSSVKFSGDVVVYGDVNAGAHIEAGGNIVVLGAIRGLAQAGAPDDASAIILSFDLQPTQVRIGRLIAVPPKPQKGGGGLNSGLNLSALLGRDRSERSYAPVVAYVRDGHIIFEDYRGKLPG